MMTVNNKTVVLWRMINCVFYSIKNVCIVSSWFDQKNMWQVSCLLYLIGQCEWCHTKINGNQKCRNIIFHDNDSIHGFDATKKYFKAK